MNFNFDLFIDVLCLGTLCGLLSVICFQKFKETLLITNKKIISFLSIIVDIIFGYFISNQFTDFNKSLCVCIGIFAWISSKTIYKKLKEKFLLKSSDDLLINYHKQLRECQKELEEVLENK